MVQILHHTVKMKKIIVIVAILFCTAPWQTASAQQGDTIYMANLPEVVINEKWPNDTLQYRYNQMKYYVVSVLPYVNAATKLFNEINAKVNQPGISKTEKRKYVNSREDELRDQFETKVKGLNTTQGTLLIKLIARQTGANIYGILDEFKNPLTAVKWQTWARLNGINLNKKYRPEEERMLEQIMESLDYPLPPFYSPLVHK